MANNVATEVPPLLGQLDASGNVPAPGAYAPGTQVAIPSPPALLQSAIAAGANIEVLERLMGLAERWQAAQARMAYESALSALRADLPPILKTQKVDFTTTKGRTQYRYEDLAEVVETLSPALAQHGLSFRWRTDTTQKGSVSVTCILAHGGGTARRLRLPAPSTPAGTKIPSRPSGVQ